MNIITKLKNIRKKAQREVSSWQINDNYSYQDTIEDIADMVSIYGCKQIGIHADWNILNSFLLLNTIKPRQLARLVLAARKKSKLVKLAELVGKTLPDLRTVSFV